MVVGHGSDLQSSFIELKFLKLIFFLFVVVSGLNGEATYDYVFGGPLPHRSAVSHSTLKLTSPPVRLRSDSRNFCKPLLSRTALIYNYVALIISFPSSFPRCFHFLHDFRIFPHHHHLTFIRLPSIQSTWGCFFSSSLSNVCVLIKMMNTDTQQRSKFGGSLDDGRTSSSHSHFHYQTPRRSPGNSLKRSYRRIKIDASRGSRTSLKSNGDDADILQQLLIE